MPIIDCGGAAAVIMDTVLEVLSILGRYNYIFVSLDSVVGLSPKHGGPSRLAH